MPTVHIPAAMRSLTGGEASVVVPGKTLGEVVEELEARYPGLKDRMTEGGKLRRGLAAFVNDQSPHAGLQTGHALADVLFGDYKPTGKLSFSWPRAMGQIPINVGDANYSPQFPFGYGLTY